jgi:hypothetical protein
MFNNKIITKFISSRHTKKLRNSSGCSLSDEDNIVCRNVTIRNKSLSRKSIILNQFQYVLPTKPKSIREIKGNLHPFDLPRRFMGGRMLSDLNNFYRIRQKPCRIRSVFYKRCRFPMKSDTDSIGNDRIHRSDWISWVSNNMKYVIKYTILLRLQYIGTTFVGLLVNEVLIDSFKFTSPLYGFLITWTSGYIVDKLPRRAKKWV